MRILIFTLLCLWLCSTAHAQTEQKVVTDTIKEKRLTICPKALVIDMAALSAGVYTPQRSSKEVKFYTYPYTNTNDIVAAMTGAYQRRRGDDVLFFGGR